VAFKYTKNPFPQLQCPETPDRLGGDTPPHIQSHWAPTLLRCSPCVPRIPARSIYAYASLQGSLFHFNSPFPTMPP